jgi:DNA polymerase-1
LALFGGIEVAGRPDLENCRKLDLLPIPMIRRAHRLGIAIDPPYFRELSVKFGVEMASLEKDIASYIPPERLHEFVDRTDPDNQEEAEELAHWNSKSALSFNAGSPEQIGKLLFEMLQTEDGKRIGQDKRLKYTKSGDQISTGKKQLELLRLEHPVIPLVLRFRELRTLQKNYANKLPRLAKLHPRSSCCPICELSHSTDQWRVHGEMGTTRAETGRINHKNPNLGNVPNRTEDGRAIQAGFVAPEGHRLVACDLSQIELRTLAHLANEPTMIEIYKANGDIHDRTGRTIFNLRPDQKPDKSKHRVPSKKVAFSIANGTTGKGLFLGLVMDYGIARIPVPDWLTEQWCDWLLGEYLKTYTAVQPYFDLQHYRARRYGMVWDLFGRVRLIPEVKSYHRWIREAGLRQAQGMPITATAAGQLKLAMGKAEAMLTGMLDCGVWCWPLLTIHDAIMVEAEEDYAEQVLEALGAAMDTVMVDEETGEHCFRVPILSDGEVMYDDKEQISRWRKA